ncbi:glycerol-3-phosphate dehydrogenase [Gaertneriomyces semiglobifer]|nr:glycerol-3-phosphate dehydrogenase [Gaertneriomyces semiglobifer]
MKDDDWKPVPPPPRAASRPYDVLIVGAGAVGCSIARELSKYKLRTLVLEKADDVAQGASKANSGIVHGGYDERHGTLKSKVAHRGNLMFEQLDKELNFGFRRTGALVLCYSPEEITGLRELMENGEKNGVRDLQILNREQVRQREPHVHPDVYAALYCPGTGITSPYEYTIALAENAITNGVDIKLKQEVIDIQRAQDGGFVVKTDAGLSFTANVVINCAGLFSDRIAAMVGANSFSISPWKGEYIILNKSQAHLAKHVIFPLPSRERGKGILVSQTYHGNLLLGPTSRSMHEAAMTNKEVLRSIITSARHSLPDFDVGAAITSYTGLRAKCSRGDFVIEEAPDVKGFINVAGIDSPGLTSSPAVAKLVVDILKGTGVELAPNNSFNPYRPAIIIRKGPDFEGVIDDEDPTKNIICRCERVTESEIVDAIHRPLPARSVDAVKKRTRAGMGPCQGNFCEPRVVELIARETGIPEDLVPRRGRGTSVLPHRRLTPEDRELLAELSKETPASQKAKL